MRWIPSDALTGSWNVPLCGVPSFSWVPFFSLLCRSSLYILNTRVLIEHLCCEYPVLPCGLPVTFLLVSLAAEMFLIFILF